MCMHKKQKNEYDVLNSYVKYQRKWWQYSYDILNFFCHIHQGHSYKVYSYKKKRVVLNPTSSVIIIYP